MAIKKVDDPMQLLAKIKETANNTQKTLFSFIAIIVYAIITVYGISDKDLIYQKLPVKLPIFNINVALSFFYIGAPIIIIFIYLYLNFNHLCLIELLEELREKHPALLKTIHNQSLMIFMENPVTLFRKIEKLIILFLRWWTLPMAFLLLTFKYIKTHDRIGLYILCVLATLAFFINFFVYNRYFSDNKKSINLLIKIFIIIFILLNLSCISLLETGLLGINLYFNVIDLSYQDLRESKNENLRYSGSLKDKHLEGANLTGAYCKDMDLKGCHLLKAKLDNCNFENVNFSNSHLDSASFKNANLNGAIFKNINTKRDIDFEKANLSSAKFINFCFKDSSDAKPVFINANLVRAFFYNVDFKFADFNKSNLEFSCFVNSNLEKSIFSETSSTGITFKNINRAANNLKYSTFEKAFLECANFQESNLTGVKFINAHLEGADFWGANIYKTEFTNAYIENTKFYEVKNQNSAIFNENMDWQDNYSIKLESYRVLKLQLLIKERKSLKSLLIPVNLTDNFFTIEAVSQKQIISDNLNKLYYSVNDINNILNEYTLK